MIESNNSISIQHAECEAAYGRLLQSHVYPVDFLSLFILTSIGSRMLNKNNLQVLKKL